MQKPYIHDTAILSWIPSLNSFSLSLQLNLIWFSSQNAMSSVWNTTKLNRKCCLFFSFLLRLVRLIRSDYSATVNDGACWVFLFSSFFALLFSITLNSRRSRKQLIYSQNDAKYVYLYVCLFYLFDVVDLVVLVYQNGC